MPAETPSNRMTQLPAQSSPARVIMLWLPEWDLVATRSMLGIPVGTKLALTAKGRIHACSAMSAADGVAPGIKVREAQLRCPELQLHPHDPSLVARAFETYLRALEQAVPFIHVVRPGLAAVRADGTARFYGSEHAAGRLLRDVLHEAGAPDVRAAVADGLFCAEQAVHTTTTDHPWRVVPAGGSANFLAPLPISRLTDTLGDQRTTSLLQRMGIRTIGAFAQLPRSQVHARFGATGLLAHQLATGSDSPTLRRHEVSPDLSRRVILDPPCVETDAVLSATEQPTEEFIARLGRGSLICQEVRIGIRFESGALDERTWRHPWPLTAADIHERLRWQLDELVIGTNADQDVVSDAMSYVEFSPATTAHAAHHAQGLWGERPDDHVVHTITRLQRRLGHTGVLTAQLSGGRLLHERTELRPWGDGDSPEAAQQHRLPWPGSLTGLLPATVYPHAQAAIITSDEGSSVEVDDRGQVSAIPTWMTPPKGSRARITSWAGPWPVRQRWWRRNSSKFNRFQVVTDSRAWVLLCDGTRWWAEGHYA